ncbi:MAG: hypothetical protein F6J93_16655 [Oscillatoria sp. SIO1A7]|nr:hypothetical protein [Oscillatoria sp. SIO1A7]
MKRSQQNPPYTLHPTPYTLVFCPMPHAQCPMPNTKFFVVPFLPAKLA